MATVWEESWTEVWSAGSGPARSYCGIAVTEDGFAVDVFHGDTCVDSTVHASWAEAEQQARAMRTRHLRVAPPPVTSTEWDRPAAP